MSDPKPNLEGQSPTGSATVNEIRLESTNSQIGNASQVVNSPGAVVSQTITQVQMGANSAAIILGGFALLAAQAFLPSVRSYAGFNGFVVGGALAMIVFGFFSWVECLLRPTVRVDIAGWLVGLKVGQKVEPWPNTFLNVFDRVFGTKYSSWRCLLRSITATSIVLVLGTVAFSSSQDWSVPIRVFNGLLDSLRVGFVVNVLPDYLSLMKTRYAVRLMTQKSLSTWIVLFIDGVVDIGIACFTFWASFWVFTYVVEGFHENPVVLRQTVSVMRTMAMSKEGFEFGLGLFFFPVFFTSIWLWLYAGSGFLLKAARRFDIGFRWFNRTFDIENKPLSAIGLVAGALVAGAYWSVAIAAHMLR